MKQKLLLSQFEYDLPSHLIAHEPNPLRDSSKLMIIKRNENSISTQIFSDLPKFLKKGDVLVFNNSKVFPARLMGTKKSGGKCEVLLVKNIANNVWEILGKNLPKEGDFIYFNKLCSKVIKKGDDTRLIEFECSHHELREYIKNHGITPTPPYIKSLLNEQTLRQKYQTIYAQNEGSIAAPTAGIHFTDKVFKELKAKNMGCEYVTLHVGPGTFLPIKTDVLTDHKMHSESFVLSDKTVEKLNQIKQSGGRIIAVGTTTCRVLESCTNNAGILIPQENETNIFIYPPYKFKFVDGLITNFHLPHSTLLALVSAFVTIPNTKTKFENFEKSLMGSAYEEAIKQNYKFFSFGDASLIL